MFVLLVVKVRLFELLKELFDVVLRVVKLSFLTETVDSVGDTNGNASELNSIRFFPEGFLEVDGVFKALVVQGGFFFKTSKYF